MSKKVILEVNDYLDLYILAKNLGDQAWQNEILEQLHHYDDTEIKNQKDISSLWAQFKTINDEILHLYQQLRVEPNNSTFLDKILTLKQQRISLSKQIQLKQSKSLQTI